MSRGRLLLIAGLSLCCACGGRPVGNPDGGTGTDSRFLLDFPYRLDRGPGPEFGMKFDYGSYDHWVPPKLDKGTPCSKVIGTPCVKQSDCCGSALNCVTMGTGARICTRKCKPDEPQTPLVNEDSCPNLAKYVCGGADPVGPKSYCLQKCTPALGKATCPKGLACRPESSRHVDWSETAVCVYRACTGASSCPVRLSQGCNLTTPGPLCKGPGLPAGAFCAPDEPGSVSGKCALGGVCDKVSGLCKPHKLGKSTAKVGDPCKDDRDCGSNMRCDQQSAAGGVIHARNGYCTVVGCSFASTLWQFACPSGSTCHRLFAGGRCYKTCVLTSASDCRGHPGDKHGDYDCYTWTKLTTGGVVIAKAPTCEPVDPYPCSFFASAKLDCSYLGLQGNPTQMACRDRTSGKVLPKGSAAGYCLDNTASGK